MEGFAACFGELEDPRTGNAGRHDLLEILVIALCTLLCGGETAVDMADSGEAKEGFLRAFRKLEHGIPRHDTFSRVFRFLNPDQFRAGFMTFMACFRLAGTGPGVAHGDGDHGIAAGLRPHRVFQVGRPLRPVAAQGPVGRHRLDATGRRCYTGIQSSGPLRTYTLGRRGRIGGRSRGFAAW